MISRRGLFTTLFGVAAAAGASESGVVDGSYRFTCRSRPDLCEETYGEDRSKWPVHVDWKKIYLYNSDSGENDIQVGLASFGDQHGHLVWRIELPPEDVPTRHEGYGEEF